MSLLEDLDLSFVLSAVNHRFSSSMSTEPCATSTDDGCRDDALALEMKLIAIALILSAGAIGVAIPLVGRKRRFLRTDGGLFVFAKAFAAGVILATGFVHMLHDAQSALTNPCLPRFPWKRFPFSGFVAMVAALLTLVVDFVGTQLYERKHREEEVGAKREAAAVAAAVAAEEITVVMDDGNARGHGHGEGDRDGDHGEEKMHIVGMHAHAAAHRHSHAHGDARACGHGHHGHGDDGQVSSHVRHVVVSQDCNFSGYGRSSWHCDGFENCNFSGWWFCAHFERRTADC